MELDSAPSRPLIVVGCPVAASRPVIPEKPNDFGTTRSEPYGFDRPRESSRLPPCRAAKRFSSLSALAAPAILAQFQTIKTREQAKAYLDQVRVKVQAGRAANRQCAMGHSS